MKELRCTLIADGPTDRALIPPLSWLLRQHLADYAVQWEWADLRRFNTPPKRLPGRIQLSLQFYPCDLLFIHRDAEAATHAARIDEIVQAVTTVPTVVPPVVCVVPVRMQEAWLLIDELALRHAAGNPHGKNTLPIPRPKDLESVPDPKETLYKLLRDATSLNARRRKKMPVSTLTYRVAELINNFSPLRVLPAFRALEEELVRTIHEQHWI